MIALRWLVFIALVGCAWAADPGPEGQVLAWFWLLGALKGIGAAALKGGAAIGKAAGAAGQGLMNLGQGAMQKGQGLLAGQGTGGAQAVKQAPALVGDVEGVTAGPTPVQAPPIHQAQTMQPHQYEQPAHLTKSGALPPDTLMGKVDAMRNKLDLTRDRIGDRLDQIPGYRQYQDFQKFQEGLKMNEPAPPERDPLYGQPAPAMGPPRGRTDWLRRLKMMQRMGGGYRG